MSATLADERSTVQPERRRSRSNTEKVARADAPPLSPRLQLVRAILILVVALSVSILLQLIVVSALQQRSSQQRLFDSFRSELALGTASIGPNDTNGDPVPIGAPVAYLEIPSIGLKQVVVEGTTSAALFDGPGHRRDSPLPGQIGTSAIFGRRASYGGPFSDISKLEQGDLIRATTGQGVFEYNVIGVRREGDPLPPTAGAGVGRLLLVTADGRPFLPDGVVRVDAEMAAPAVVGPARLLTPASLPPQERVMAGDGRTLWALALWIQAMIMLTLGAVWAWHRWGRVQAWVVFFPPLLLVGLMAAGQAARILPNLL
jgi:sortase (surface protein transpeptidase)